MTNTSRRLLRLCSLFALGALLGGCDDGRVDMTLSADAPAQNLQNLFVVIDGVTLRREDGSEERIRLDQQQRVDLLRYNGSDYTLISNESLDEDTYDGIRLDFRDVQNCDSGNCAVTNTNGRIPLTIEGADTFSALDFRVSDNGRSYVLQLRMDLRLSLENNSNSTSRLRLRPTLRAARDSRAASVSGTVRNSIVDNCNRNNNSGIAVYAFDGRDVTPDDFDGADPDPVASAPVTGSSSNWRYTLGTLPPGDYTLALTCFGDREDPFRDDSSGNSSLSFRDGARNVSLGSGDSETGNFK